MTFSQYAGTAIVPTLARIVLAVAFVSSGWNKVFERVEITADEATQMKAVLGVDAEPMPVPTTADASGVLRPGAFDGRLVLASFRQEPGEPSAVLPPVEPPVPTTVPSAGDSSVAPPVITPPPATTPLASGKYRVRGVYRIAMLLHANNFPQPRSMAWVAAFTELFGGAMLLIGLFSRIWGLGLSIAMGVAFYLVSMKINGIFTMYPHIFAKDIPNFNTAFCQAGLFVLAFGIFLTGAGPLSLDRILFGGSDVADPGEVKID